MRVIQNTNFNLFKWKALKTLNYSSIIELNKGVLAMV